MENPRPRAVFAQKNCRRAFISALCFLLSTSCLLSQTTTEGQYRVYALRYQSVADVERMLLELLADVDPKPHIVADTRQNQLLVSGTDAVHAIVRQLIESVDRLPAVKTSPQKPVVKMYSCPADQLESIAEKLRSLNGEQERIRVATIPEQSQLAVLAQSNVHDVIQQQLRAWGVSAVVGTNHIAQPTELPRSSDQFVLLTNRSVDRVETMLQTLLGDRLKRNTASQTSYAFTNSAGRGIKLTIDRGRKGVIVSGDQDVSKQFVRLLHMLDSSPVIAGQKVRILPVRRADPVKIKQAVEAYRSEGHQHDAPTSTGPTPTDLPNPAPQPNQVHGAPPNNQTQRDRHTAIQQTGFQQDAPQPDGANNPPATGDSADDDGQPPSEMRELGGDVEIETLPDLDVIILRGRDHDVEELTHIIEELERLSVEAQPEIEIYYLKSVRGESLVTIVEQIREQLVGGRQGEVSVIPLMKPNALLLIGWGEALTTVKTLIRKLDQPVSPATRFKVFRLEHAAAATAQATIQQFFTGRTGLGPKVQVTADPRSNSLVVEAAPRDMAEVDLLIRQLDTSGSSAVNRAQIFRLKNTLAANLAATLQTAIQAAAGGTANQKSAILEMLTIDAEGERILKSGVLSDVQITPDPRTNTLLISAPAESMELLETLIRQLDEIAAATSQIKVFRILNGDATSLIRMLQTLLPSQSGATNVPQLASAEGETSLVPVRFAVDVRTNSIVATGSAGDLEIVEALLLRLDEKDVLERKNSVYRLRNAPAIDVARAINDFLRSERDIEQAAPGATSPFLQIEHEVIVVPETVSNSLILSATPKYFDEIMELVEELDAQPSQVMIQVLIAEVALGNLDEFGVELGLQDSVLFDRSLLANIEKLTTITKNADGQISKEEIISQEGTPGFNFNNQPLGNNVGRNASRLAGQAMSNFGLDRVNSDLQFGGLVLSASNESVSVLIRALKEAHRLEILSRPQIMTLDNQPAFIQVGQRVPRIVGTSVNNSGQVNSIALENIGLILGVTPRISPDGMVVMDIDAEKSDLGPETEGIPVSVSATGNVIRSPSVNITTAQTTVSAADGQTIVLGGLITKKTSNITRRVPWLGDLPVLGRLFRYDSETAERTELLIIMTPHVMTNEKDAERVKMTEAARMHWCTADVHELLGDGSFCLPGTCPICDGNLPVIYPDSNLRGRFLPAPAAEQELAPSAGGHAPLTAPMKPTELNQQNPSLPMPILPPQDSGPSEDSTSSAADEALQNISYESAIGTRAETATESQGPRAWYSQFRLPGKPRESTMAERPAKELSAAANQPPRLLPSSSDQSRPLAFGKERK